MGIYAITGAASGIGAATTKRLKGDGHTVIGIDIQEADIVADLSKPTGRAEAIEQVLEKSGGSLEGFVPCAGVMGLPNRAGSLLVSLNYFGAIDLLEGFREALSQGESAAAVGVSSNSTTISPGVPNSLIQACLEGDEEKACKMADDFGSMLAYPATKTALAYWIRRHAVTPEWIGSGINLNAIAPGMIETAMTAEGLADPLIGPHIKNLIVPTKRPGKPEEIADFLAFLLGPKGRFFVGSILFCDGGTDAEIRPDAWPSPMPTP